MGGVRLREVIAYGGSTFPETVKEHTFSDILQSFDLYSDNFIEVRYLTRNSLTTFSNPNTGRILNIIHLQCANQRCQVSPPPPPPPQTPILCRAHQRVKCSRFVLVLTPFLLTD